MKYKEQKNLRTGETRWVPIEGSENLIEKINKVPILGSITTPISKVISGAVAGSELNKNLGTVSASSQNQQQIALELTRLAKNEKDPIKKQRLLDRSKQISQGAGSQLEGYVNPVMETMPQDYQNKATPTTPKQMAGAYGMDALSAGIAAGAAYSIPSEIKGGIDLLKGGVNLVKRGVSAVKNKASSVSTAEKVRQFVQKVNPQVKATDANYLQKKNAIIEFAKKFIKTGKESAEQIMTSASNKRDFNLKAVNTILGKTDKPTDYLNFGKKILKGLNEVEVDPKNPAVKVAVKNVDRMLTNVVDESGKISPTKLYELYGKIGEKAFGTGVREVKPIYQKVYELLGSELKTVSPKVRNMIAENDKIRKLLPGVIKTTKAIAKKGFMGGFAKRLAQGAASTAGVIGMGTLLGTFLSKKK